MVLRDMAGRLRAPWRFAPATCVLSLACAAAFAAQRVLGRVPFMVEHPFAEPFTFIFGVHPPLLAGGFFWQPLTYAFLHGSWLHLLVNFVGILFFGFALEMELGARRFLLLFFASSVAGGLFWALGEGVLSLLSDLRPFETCIGASGGAYGLVGAFTALYASRRLTVLVYFIPMRLRGKTLAWVVLAVTVLDATFDITGTAYAAHFAGFVAGWFAGRRLRGEGFGEA